MYVHYQVYRQVQANITRIAAYLVISITIFNAHPQFTSIAEKSDNPFTLSLSLSLLILAQLGASAAKYLIIWRAVIVLFYFFLFCRETELHKMCVR